MGVKISKYFIRIEHPLELYRYKQAIRRLSNLLTCEHIFKAASRLRVLQKHIYNFKKFVFICQLVIQVDIFTI
jgi:hypothetical protein